jgi:hypothetical protein
MLMIGVRIPYVSSSIAADSQVIELRDGFDSRVCWFAIERSLLLQSGVFD